MGGDVEQGGRRVACERGVMEDRPRGRRFDTRWGWRMWQGGGRKIRRDEGVWWALGLNGDEQAGRMGEGSCGETGRPVRRREERGAPRTAFAVVVLCAFPPRASDRQCESGLPHVPLPAAGLSSVSSLLSPPSSAALRRAAPAPAHPPPPPWAAERLRSNPSRCVSRGTAAGWLYVG